MLREHLLRALKLGVFAAALALAGATVALATPTSSAAPATTA
jgi:hypothetical protein